MCLGIFGDYTQDNVVVSAGQTTTLPDVVWSEESSGTFVAYLKPQCAFLDCVVCVIGSELWRIGIPDHTAGR